LQPGSKRLWLPLPHQGQKLLREGNCFRDLGRLGAQLGELLRLGLAALRRAPQHDPGRSARR
jgi:hypothetical protein